MSVQRYYLDHEGYIEPKNEGDLVMYEDYKELEAKLADANECLTAAYLSGVAEGKSQSKPRRNK